MVEKKTLLILCFVIHSLYNITAIQLGFFGTEPFAEKVCEQIENNGIWIVLVILAKQFDLSETDTI